jgi:AraC family transcriptional regulator
MPDKIFIGSQFRLIHRNAQRIHWSIEAQPDFVFVFLIEGVVSLRFGDEEKSFAPSSVLILNTGARANIAGSSVETITMNLSPAYILDCAVRSKLVKHDAQITFRLDVIEDNTRITRLFENIIEELKEKEAGQEIIIASLIEQLVIYLLRHYANVQRSNELELTRVGLVDRRIRRAIELMHAQLDRELSIEELAAAAYISPFHFSRLFKKFTGATPHSYLASLRISRAQTLLAETDFSITQIASRVGYSSSSHFTKAFRQATGLTPKEFRNSIINAETRP